MWATASNLSKLAASSESLIMRGAAGHEADVTSPLSLLSVSSCFTTLCCIFCTSPELWQCLLPCSATSASSTILLQLLSPLSACHNAAPGQDAPVLAPEAFTVLQGKHFATLGLPGMPPLPQSTCIMRACASAAIPVHICGGSGTPAR